jgi:NAD(P)H-hydrate epimerase
MTKGGTGDVLAGICSGLVAQKYGLFEAGCIAAFLNGAIGDLEKKKRGYSFIASDMLNDIKRILG